MEIKRLSWAGSAAYTPVTTNDISIKDIHKERLIELWNEGDRLDYLRALRMDIPAGDRDDQLLSYDSPRLVLPTPVTIVP